MKTTILILSMVVAFTCCKKEDVKIPTYCFSNFIPQDSIFMYGVTSDKIGQVTCPDTIKYVQKAFFTFLISLKPLTLHTDSGYILSKIVLEHPYMAKDVKNYLFTREKLSKAQNP
jgi:hypothetical protein